MNSKILFFVVFATTLLSCNTEAKKETVEDTQKEMAVNTPKETVYNKLGGAEGISAIVDEIIEIHLQNENIKQYFIPLKENPEYFEQFKQHVKDFFAAGTGGSEEYKGRDMPAAHQGLNLSEADFLHAVDDILLVLDKRQIDRSARNEVLATLYSMKWAVIGK